MTSTSFYYSSGVSAQGPQGEKGDKGDQGDLGPIGPASSVPGPPGVGVLSVKSKGASTANSNAVNKAALQSLISDMSAAGTGYAIADSDLNYGLVETDLSTYPDFTGALGDLVVADYTQADADGAGNKAGAQVRLFFHTQQTSPLGMHNGGGMWLSANWNPYLLLQNTAQIQAVGHPSRTADDNYRATILWKRDAHDTWALMQGSLVSATATATQLTSIGLRHFQAPGDPLPAYYVFLANKTNGAVVWGKDTNSNVTSFDVSSVVTGMDQGMFENPFGTRSRLILRNSVGSGNDAYVDNNAGDLQLGTTAGPGLTISRASGRVKIALGFCQNRRTYADTATVTIDAAIGNLNNINVTTAAAFTIAAPINSADGQRISIKISNQSGGVMGAIAWDPVFKKTTFVSPANGFQRIVDFWFDGVNWIQCDAEVPN